MKRLLLLLAFVVGGAPGAQAQTWTDRGYLSVNGGLQMTSTTSTDVIQPIDFGEAAVVNTTYHEKQQPGFDVTGGVRVWRYLSVGVSVSRFSKDQAGSVSAQEPHPFFFNQARSVAGDTAGLQHSETAAHVEAAWTMPVGDRMQIGVFGGPSWFDVTQDVVHDILVNQTYPYDTATFASAVTERLTASRLGFNAGADVARFFSRHAGVGFGVDYTHARVPLTSTLRVNAGGAHIRGGLRLRF